MRGGLLKVLQHQSLISHTQMHNFTFANQYINFQHSKAVMVLLCMVLIGINMIEHGKTPIIKTTVDLTD